MSTDPLTLTEAHLAELRRQRDALQSELDSLAAHDPNTLARFGLYTGAAMAEHAARVRELERARFTPEEQANATRRAREQDAADLEAFRARQRAHARGIANLVPSWRQDA